MKKIFISILTAAMLFQSTVITFAAWETDTDNTSECYKTDFSDLDGWEVTYPNGLTEDDTLYAKIIDKSDGSLTAPYFEICDELAGDEKGNKPVKAKKQLNFPEDKGLVRVEFKYSVNHGNYNAKIMLSQGNKRAVEIGSFWVGDQNPTEIDGELQTPMSGNTWRIYISDLLGTGSSDQYALAPTTGTGDDKTWCDFEILINLSDNKVKTITQEGKQISIGGGIYAVSMTKGKNSYMLKGKLPDGISNIDGFSVSSYEWPNGGSKIRVDDLSAEYTPIVNIDNKFINEVSVKSGESTVTEPSQLTGDMTIENFLYNQSLSDKSAAVLAVLSRGGYMINASAADAGMIPHYKTESEKTGKQTALELKTDSENIFGDMELSVYTLDSLKNLRPMCDTFRISKSAKQPVAYTADTETPSIDAETNMLTYCGTTSEGGSVTYAVMKEGTELSDTTTAADFIKGLYDFGETKADSNGKYAFNVKFAGNDAKYTLIVSDGSGVKSYELDFKNEKAKSIVNALENIKNKDEVKPELDSFLEAVRFSNRLYNTNLDAIQSSSLFYEIFYDEIKKNPVKTTDDVLKATKTAVYLYVLSGETDRNSFNEIMAENIDMFDTTHMYARDLYNDTDLTDSAVKAAIAVRLADRTYGEADVLSDAEKFSEVFGDSTVLAICESTVGSAAGKRIIGLLNDKFGVSDSGFSASYKTYAALGSTLQDSVASKIMKNNYESIDKLTERFKASVTEASKTGATEKPSYSGGSSSRGGGGGGGTFTAPRKEQPSDLTPPAYDIPKKSEGVTFTDLDDAEWARDYITKLSGRGIVSGDESGRFNPDSPILREEFVKMLVKTLGIETVYVGSDFEDVPHSVWYYEFVSAAYANGIVNGVDGSRFGAGLEITREDMCTMLYRALKRYGVYMPEASGDRFSDDSNISDYARGGVYALKKINAVGGFPDGSFGPKRNATRAEVAKILSEVIDYADTANNDNAEGDK